MAAAADVAAVQTRFADLYGGSPDFVVRAPGRVNLIGEHTDYNEGFVFPAAIDFDILAAGSVRRDGQIRAYTTTEGVGRQSTSFSLDTFERADDAPWSNYLRSVAAVLQAEGYSLTGLNLVFEGAIPIGSGLSSSAAMETASCLALEAGGGFNLEPVRRAQLCQQAEWNPRFVGVQCGIMDQLICGLGRPEHALFIDTRTLECRPAPIPQKTAALIIADTHVSHSLAGETSDYNARRTECEQAADMLRARLPGLRTLRDVSLEQFASLESTLPEPLRRRARHVVTEDERVLRSVDALNRGDLHEFGRLMFESHASLRNDFEVSCRELDELVEAARQVDGVVGSRMTGAGFGGCTITLARPDASDEFRRAVGARYRAATGIEASFYTCRASAGAERIA